MKLPDHSSLMCRVLNKISVGPLHWLVGNYWFGRTVWELQRMMGKRLGKDKLIVTRGYWKRYRNPDKRCKYPFSPEPLGYCWSYANCADGDPKFRHVKKGCDGCEFWEEPKICGA